MRVNITDMSFKELLAMKGDEYFDIKVNRDINLNILEKTFVVFGTSDVSELVITYLKSLDKNIDICCFAKNSDLYNTDFFGANIMSYEEGLNKNSLENFIFIVVDKPSENNDCLRFLLEKNIPKFQIYTKTEFLLSDMDFLKYYVKNLGNQDIYTFLYYVFISDKKIISENIEKLEKVYSFFSDKESLYLFKERVLYSGNENISLLEKHDLMSQYILNHYYQYLDEIICPQKENSVFFDCGCYDSLTAIKYADIVRNRYKKIISFEPLDEAFEISLKKSKNAKLHDHIILKSGLYDSKCTLKFTESGDSSKIDGSGTTSIEVTTIDHVVNEYNLDDVGFIKMDIEGAEEKALLGAAKTIAKFQPNLAICLYHNVTDFYELPLLIKKLNPNYKLTIRKYEFDGELVCYATVD